LRRRLIEFSDFTSKTLRRCSFSVAQGHREALYPVKMTLWQTEFGCKRKMAGSLLLGIALGPQNSLGDAL
jgi:hypothetical protein